ncbi:four helix bundle protein [Gracilimonas sediminicola]|uniref:Four helix bundle protein n=1 Tax=Gracilimonas sediminicola TaxID=2952158 RepID=A0A9X2L3S3_9BACT|nr:four helix bundle protein [Gracilimonas sediminicola]MCP9291788.1 four helix bundle protein [Gracilimonas sediminicola]
MSKIERYEDLKCWQQSRLLVNQIYKLVSDSSLKKEFALTDQLKRASISVMTNIAEGFNRYHKKDFIRFLDYSQSSAQEVKSLLYIVEDQGMIETERIKEIQNNCDHCQAMVLSLINHINNTLKNSNQTNEPEVLYISDEYLGH